MAEMSPRLAFAIETARTAGQSTISLFRAGAEFAMKSNDSPVTQADLEAERIVRSEIERRYPGEAVLGEEMGGEEAEDQWTVDPIDGTKSFIAGVPAYATLLSYEQAGEPVLGVCYFPALDEIVYAERGEGAFWDGEPCRVSGRTELGLSILCTGGHLTLSKTGRMAGFLSLAERALGTRGWGDAYGHALVATGRVEAMVDPMVNRWDVSAMSVIVREAGGSFTDFSGGEALSDEAISCAPGVRDAVLEAFRA